MSSYSTTNITRETAKAALIHCVLTLNDSKLEEMIDALIFEQRLRRCRIVENDEENEDHLLK